MIISRYVKIKSFNQHQYCTILEIECKDEGRIYPKVGFLTILQAPFFKRLDLIEDLGSCIMRTWNGP